LFGVDLWVWLLALLSALIVVGPALGPGSLLNLDLLAFDNADLPRGTWGLGPELPRRVPLGTMLAPLSALLGGELVAKFLLVAIIVTAFIGAYRFVGSLLEQCDPDPTIDRFDQSVLALGGAALWALGPFLLTRLAVGHWPIAVSAAFLPWVMPTFVRPVRSTRSIFLASALLAIGGPYGAALSGGYLTASMLRRDQAVAGASRLRCAAAWLGAQSVWLVPSLIVLLGTDGRRLMNSSGFATDVQTPLDVFRLAVGMGFWNQPFQVSGDGSTFSTVVAVVVVVLAIIGTRSLPNHWRLPILLPAAAALVLTIASCIPGIDAAFARLTDTAVGSILRDAQRFLAPFLLWVAVAAPAGARDIRRRIRGRSAAAAGAIAAIPLVIALMLAGPGTWGFGGQLRPSTIPDEWVEARSAVRAEPGTMLALPWFAYFTADVGGNRLVQNPLSSYFDGDVIRSSDLRISQEPMSENADPRESAAATIVDHLRGGEAQSAALAELGIRWVAVAHDVDWMTYSGLRVDPGLRVVVDGPTLTLYEVDGVGNGTITESGEVDAAQPHLLPYWSASNAEAITMPVPYQFGWLRGLRPGTVGPDGRLSLPAGDGPIWFWPALVVIAADILWTAAVILALRERKSAHVAASGVGPASRAGD
jgi:hypothetical protein